jgi:hypothetical protein
MTKYFYSSADIFSEIIDSDQDISFLCKDTPDPYLEICSPCINEIDFDKVIEINLLLRFSYVADSLFLSKINDSLRNQLVNLILHYYSSIDLHQGMNVKYLSAEIFSKWLRSGACGNQNADLIIKMEIIDKDLFLKFIGILINHFFSGFFEGNLYAAFQLFFPNGALYQQKNRPKSLILFLNRIKSDTCDTMVLLLKSFLIPLEYEVTICYENHFGIIGMDETMQIDHITILETKEDELLR